MKYRTNTSIWYDLYKEALVQRDAYKKRVEELSAQILKTAKSDTYAWKPAQPVTGPSHEDRIKTLETSLGVVRSRLSTVEKIQQRYEHPEPKHRWWELA